MPDAPHEILVRSRRRAPRYRAFVGTGALAGVLLALITTFFLQFEPVAGATTYTLESVFGYTALLFGLLGAMLGGIAAILLERRR